jgi:hypothetical protein
MRGSVASCPDARIRPYPSIGWWDGKHNSRRLTRRGQATNRAVLAGRAAHRVAVIRLLLQGRSRQSDGVWSDITGQYVTALRRAGVGSEEQAARVAQIQNQFREMHAEHTYQVALWIVLAAFVHSVSKECVTDDPPCGS